MVDNREVYIYVLKHPDTLEIVNLLNFGGLRENLLKI